MNIDNRIRILIKLDTSMKQDNTRIGNREILNLKNRNSSREHTQFAIIPFTIIPSINIESSMVLPSSVFT